MATVKKEKLKEILQRISNKYFKEPEIKMRGPRRKTNRIITEGIVPPSNAIKTFRKLCAGLGTSMILELSDRIVKEGKDFQHIYELKQEIPILRGYRKKSSRVLLDEKILRDIMDVVERHGFLNVHESFTETKMKYILPKKILKGKEEMILDNVLINIVELLKRKEKGKWKTVYKKELTSELDLLLKEEGKNALHIVEILSKPNEGLLKKKMEIWLHLKELFKKRGYDMKFHVVYTRDKKQTKKLRKTIENHALAEHTNLYIAKPFGKGEIRVEEIKEP